MTGSDAVTSDDLSRLPALHVPRSSRSYSRQQSKRSRRPVCSSSSSGLRQTPSQKQISPDSSTLLRERISNLHAKGSRSSFRSSSGNLPSPPSSDDESFYRSVDREIHDSNNFALPTPPDSDEDEVQQGGSQWTASDGISLDGNPFPLQPIALSSVGENSLLQTPSRRFTCNSREPGTASPLVDRFVSNRSTPRTPQTPSETYRVSKTPQLLSPTERLLRHGSATPDPFGPLQVSTTRDERLNGSSPRIFPVAARSPSRIIGTTNASEVPLEPSGAQNRQVSVGAIWNVGGIAQANLNSPTRGVSDGRGGFISSGSNAPMYESEFLDDLSTNQDVDQMERRLAVAFGIDQTSKILDISRPPEKGRVVSTGSIGIKRKRLYLEPRHEWKDGAWNQKDYHSGECHSAPHSAYKCFCVKDS